MTSSITLSDVKAANGSWFDRGNQRLFGDTQYKLLRGGITREIYLVRETSRWSDMLGGKKLYVWLVNEIDQSTLEIRPLVDKEWKELDGAKEWLKGK